MESIYTRQEERSMEWQVTRNNGTPAGMVHRKKRFKSDISLKIYFTNIEIKN